MSEQPSTSTTQINTHRIVYNTIMLYIRQIFILLVSLYTSRVVLQALGVEDYGIYNVVGGFVTMFNIISGSFSVAIGRFMAYELGRGDSGRLQRIFSSSLIIQVIMGIIICILITTFGSWFVKHKLVIPEERMGAALSVLILSSVAFFINLISIPYNSLIVAHEHMQAFAYIGIVEAMLKLTMAFLLTRLPFDKLVLYSVLMLVVSLVIRILYAVYCKFYFSECRFSLSFDKDVLIGMFSFTGWAFLGNGSFILKEQGVNIILNLFCGTMVNAARGITVQVNNAITGFVNNFMEAVRPQITKLYSVGEFYAMRNLIFKSARFSYYMILILCLPVIKNIDYLLWIWLGDVPDHTVPFIILFLAYSLIDSLTQPVMTGLLAEGNIRTYEILLLVLNTANLPLSYFALKIGLVPESVFVVAFVICVAVGIVRIWLSRRAFGLSARDFILQVISNATLVTALSGGIVYFIQIPIQNEFMKFVLTSVLTVFVTGFIICFCGMNKEERYSIMFFIRKFLIRS